MRGGFPSIAAGLLLLMSLSAILVLPVEPIAETSPDGLSEEQVKTLEELPSSVEFEFIKSSPIKGRESSTFWGNYSLIETTADNFGGGVRGISFSPDGNLFAYVHWRGSGNNTVYVHNATTLEILTNLTFPVDNHHGYARVLSFSPNGEFLISGGSSQEEEINRGDLYIWNTSDWSFYKTLEPPNNTSTCYVESIAFSPTYPIFISNCDGLHIYNSSNWEHISTISTISGLGKIQFSPDGSMLAGADYEEIIILNTEDWSIEAIIDWSANYITSIAFSPDGTFMSASSHSNGVMVWDAPSFTEIIGWEDDAEEVTFSFDSKYLAISGQTNHVTIWDTSDWTFRGGHDFSWGCALNYLGELEFSPNGSMLAVASEEWGCGDVGILALDSDGDSVSDYIDVFPNDSNETIDTDGDGVGDNSDVFPNDSNETIDTDGDGVGDNSDEFPNDSNETNDLDQDGFGDNGDGCSSTYGTSYIDRDGCLDSDNDGYSDPDVNWTIEDGADALWNISSQWSDQDADGYGDNAPGFEADDCNSTSGSSWKNDTFGCPDDDGDGFEDNDDECPHNHGTSNIDRNGCIDQDGDGVSDLNDVFWKDANESADTDLDGVGDNSDQCPDTALNTPVDLDGCAISTKSTSDSVSSSSSNTGTMVWGAIIAFFVAIIVVVVKVRSESEEKEDDDNSQQPTTVQSQDLLQAESHVQPVEEEQIPVQEDYTSQEETYSQEVVAQPELPDSTLSGQWAEDGYEWLEHPENSGIWYWRDQQTGQWVKH